MMKKNPKGWEEQVASKWKKSGDSVGEARIPVEHINIV